MVLRRDIDVVNIKEDSVSCELHDFAQEFPLGHLRGMKLRIAADVLDADGHFEKIRVSRIFCAVTSAAAKHGIGSRS